MPPCRVGGGSGGSSVRDLPEVPSPALPPPEALRGIRLEAGSDELALLWWPLDPAPPQLAPLSATEREIALLAARGLSNREIADARGRSPRTVANQLARVFRKLGVGSRVEVAARIAGRRR